MPGSQFSFGSLDLASDSDTDTAGTLTSPLDLTVAAPNQFLQNHSSRRRAPQDKALTHDLTTGNLGARSCKGSKVPTEGFSSDQRVSEASLAHAEQTLRNTQLEGRPEATKVPLDVNRRNERSKA